MVYHGQRSTIMYEVYITMYSCVVQCVHWPEWKGLICGMAVWWNTDRNVDMHIDYGPPAVMLSYRCSVANTQQRLASLKAISLTSVCYGILL